MKAPLAVLLVGALWGEAHAEAPVAAHPNSAIVPAARLEKDFYDWDARHAAAMAIKVTLKPEIVLIGDSITHMWGGLPEETSGRGNRGLEAWKSVFRDRPVLNLGFGWDRTQNVLKRIELGELDGLRRRAMRFGRRRRRCCRGKRARLSAVLRRWDSSCHRPFIC